MSYRDFEDGVWTTIGVIVGFFALILIASTMHNCLNKWSHEELGSNGHACFANHTCRENLRCADDGSKPGVCVKK